MEELAFRLYRVSTLYARRQLYESQILSVLYICRLENGAAEPLVVPEGPVLNGADTRLQEANDEGVELLREHEDDPAWVEDGASRRPRDDEDR